MCFNKKNNTNIDDELEKETILSCLLNFVSKYKKIFLIILGIIILLILMIILFINRKITNYLILNGEDIITIYQGTDYVEPGYEAYNSKDENLLSEVVINSNLNNDVIGEYEITYTLGDITETRIVKVIDKPQEYIFIYLNTVNNNVNVYLKKGETYTEPGYQVFSSTGTNLTNEVTVTGEVDTSKKGTYKLIYSVIDSNNVTVSASRTVIVMDSELSLTLENSEYTNKEVTINAFVIDEYFDYMLLPDNTKVTTSTYSYKVSKNGKYTFKAYSKKGSTKESTIEVKNIDKVAPSGSCMIDYDNGSVIKITASDDSGIKKYVYNGKDYLNSNISLSSYIDSAKVNIYDNAGNSKEISCKSFALPTISSISNDGVIVTINAKKVNKEISGYYFSYTDQRPGKSTGGYLETSNESVDVVRLPGTTYVWVEDKSGKISSPKTITLSNDVILLTKSGYNLLQGTQLGDYITKRGGSIEALNKLIARSVRAAGLYTKEGAATAAVALQTVLAQEYNVKIPYRMGGKTNVYGALSSWGAYKENTVYEKYIYSGLDCGGFVNWSYKNTGIEWSNFAKDNFFYWDGIEYLETNGEVGDVLRTFARSDRMEHVAIIVGKTDSAFLVAEAYGLSVGVIINTYPYNNANGYEIIPGERLTEKYTKVLNSEYPSGF